MAGRDVWARRLLGGTCLLLVALGVALAALILQDRCAYLSRQGCIDLIRSGPDAARPSAMARFVGRVTGAPAAPAEPPRAEASATPARLPEPVPEMAAIVVPTDAYPPVIQYPLSAWNVVDFRGGFVDRVSLLPGRIAVDRTGARLPSGTAIELSGWAGHAAYGMRSRRVLFVACGKVVGHARTGQPRPDVEKEVHPNLARSGWSGLLAVDALPSCGDAALSVWAVASVGANVFPLAGEIPFAVERSDPAARSGFTTSPSVFRPPDNPVAVAVPLRSVKAEASIRQCASASCPVVATLSAVPVQGYVIERRGGWALVQAGEKAGWIAAAEFRSD